ncbi:hypothetical protein J6590_078814 [Homalodisca vitripennis]|nr:hypothetical protein J6590_078814 [Homalodisca vitripennis]
MEAELLLITCLSVVLCNPGDKIGHLCSQLLLGCDADCRLWSRLLWFRWLLCALLHDVTTFMVWACRVMAECNRDVAGHHAVFPDCHPRSVSRDTKTMTVMSTVESEGPAARIAKEEMSGREEELSLEPAIRAAIKEKCCQLICKVELTCCTTRPCS